MEKIENLSEKQIKGLLTKIKDLNIPYIGKRSSIYIDMYSYIDNRNVAQLLSETFFAFFYVFSGRTETAKDYLYNIGTKKEGQINEALKPFNLSTKKSIDENLLKNLIDHLIKEDIKKEREESILRELRKIRISDLPKLRRKKSEDDAVKNFLNRHFETFGDFMNIGTVKALKYLKRNDDEYFHLIRETLNKFIKEKLKK